jgi:nicotinate-nucleotide pyrophosphorylase (carboxylating)
MYKKIIRQALQEDAAFHDTTTQALIPKTQRAKGVLLAKENLVLCGIPIVQKVFQALDSRIKVAPKFREGSLVKKGSVIATISGSARTLLSGERVALNFLQRLSGIATLTQQFADKLKGTRAKIYDTRKTTPGLRELERYAVKVGGGENHRFDLSSSILVKDNHLALVGSLQEVKGRLAKLRKKKNVIVEVTNLSMLREAVELGFHHLLLDNMSIPQIRKGVEMAKAECVLEVSGRVNLKNVRAIAQTGVDRISIGALTHSVQARDISMEILA